jgi:hypothetical protein
VSESGAAVTAAAVRGAAVRGREHKSLIGLLTDYGVFVLVVARCSFTIQPRVSMTGFFVVI